MECYIVKVCFYLFSFFVVVPGKKAILSTGRLGTGVRHDRPWEDHSPVC